MENLGRHGALTFCVYNIVLHRFQRKQKQHTDAINSSSIPLWTGHFVHPFVGTTIVFPPSHYSAPETFCWDLKQKWTPRGFVVNFSNDTHELSETPSTNCI